MFSFIAGFVAGTVFGPAALILMKKLRQKLADRAAAKKEE